MGGIWTYLAASGGAVFFWKIAEYCVKHVIGRKDRELDRTFKEKVAFGQEIKNATDSFQLKLLTEGHGHRVVMTSEGCLEVKSTSHGESEGKEKLQGKIDFLWNGFVLNLYESAWLYEELVWQNVKYDNGTPIVTEANLESAQQLFIQGFNAIGRRPVIRNDPRCEDFHRVMLSYCSWIETRNPAEKDAFDEAVSAYVKAHLKQEPPALEGPSPQDALGP